MVSGRRFTESEVEESCLSWLEGLGYAVLAGPEIAPGELFAERKSFGECILEKRFRASLASINPGIPAEAIDEAVRKVLRIDSPNLVEANQNFHWWLVNGVPVEYARMDGSIAGDQVKLVDFENPENNDWLAVNQFTVIESGHNRRPDIVAFVNGLPIGVIEIKNPADEKATVLSGFRQLQTYKAEIPSLFTCNEVLVTSDGLQARIGSLTADFEWFMPWRTIEGEELAPKSMIELEVLIKGVFDKARFLDLVRNFVVYEGDKGKLPVKKMAGYHQFHAVRKAVETTVVASRPSGDRRAGVVWHTQGSGKSLTMVFFTGKIVLHPDMENPTIIVLTDRNDLDDQLFGTFTRCQGVLRQSPEQAESREDLRQKLQVASGGIIFTTVQKFMPETRGEKYPLLSDRRNIIVIADEAHRSQYDFIDGFARNIRLGLPKASFIGFTGTPIELTDKNTRAVFGNYVSIYDIQRAVTDGATVPIYYEGRLARLELREDEKPRIDAEFEEVTEGEEIEKKEKLKAKWAALEAIAGTERRLALIARDLIDHFEKRVEVMDGKAMIVCMSRRICMDLYDAIVKLRPGWQREKDEEGAIKVVMTGNAAEGPRVAMHARSKDRREKLANRFKDPDDHFKIVIVRDMWLTGFDAPSLHSMYVDKPMRGHGLMQAIARVNRVFRDKPGGLVVDYLGLADQLKKALAAYTESGGEGSTALDQEEAVAIMLEKHEICTGLFFGFERSKWETGTPSERLGLLPAAQEFILAQEDGKKRLLQAVSDLSKAFALSVPHAEAERIRDDVAFFQAVRAAVAKTDGGTGKSPEELDYAIRQLVSKAIAPDQVVDIFAAAGLKRPDLSILSDEFLAEVKGMPHRNLAVELLRKLLSGEIKSASRKNAVQARSFAAMLEKAIRAYQNRGLETKEVIEELIRLAKEMREAGRRGEQLELTDEEVAFYDALETNDSAVKVLGDEKLKTIARELVETVRKNVSIDWTMKESVRARLRTMVKRVLRKYGYPPDKQEKATETVIEQAELLCGDVVAGA
ncbi:MAG: type I restriction endonuclease subunit R [Deltaproteobacteria bacterium]|nr:type I restriction endonuclease subunit R [Deltaproteobacteria bacterium]